MAWRELLIALKSVSVCEQTQSMWGWFLGRSPCTSQPFVALGQESGSTEAPEGLNPSIGHWPLGLCVQHFVSL